jgi:hypothetical protein
MRGAGALPTPDKYSSEPAGPQEANVVCYASCWSFLLLNDPIHFLSSIIFEFGHFFSKTQRGIEKICPKKTLYSVAIEIDLGGDSHGRLVQKCFVIFVHFSCRLPYLLNQSDNAPGYLFYFLKIT